ncbi:acyl-CoA thioesterase II [Hydrogenophaga sp.]|uniref:acyl-CoA thioesterase II n=1 Tax=Hydrogenophaga sp. TaxID=1904254 RepID=UPI0035636AEB
MTSLNTHSATDRVAALHELVAQLKLERLDENLFRGGHFDIGSPSVFGGQVLGQALMAAARTVDTHGVHSLHGYFLRAGDKAEPIRYEVDRVRDGTSFTMRRVVALQHGRPIFHMSASFHVRETGVEHQRAMPDAPPPDSLRDEHDARLALREHLPPVARAVVDQARPIELRPVDPLHLLTPERSEPNHQTWLRAPGALPDDPLVHQALLAYASDFSLLGVAMRPHGLSFMQPQVQSVSLDHAMWFHRDFRFDDWLLYETDSPSASGARGFCRGNVFSRDGRLVASVAQEGLLRVRS